MTLQRDHDGAVTRARLLDAARDAFAERGFHGTTTRDIAAAAGMSPAAVYVHHRSKEAMLYEISLAGHADILGILQAVESPDPVERLREMVRAFVHFHAAGHTMARVVNYELGALAPEHRAEITGLRRRIQDEVRDVIADGVRTGVFTCQDLGMTTNAIMSLGVDVARWYRDPTRDAREGRDRWSPADVADHHARIALRMVGVTGGPVLSGE